MDKAKSHSWLTYHVDACSNVIWLLGGNTELGVTVLYIICKDAEYVMCSYKLNYNK